MVQIGKEDVIPSDDSKKDATIDVFEATEVARDARANSCELCRAVADAGCCLDGAAEADGLTATHVHVAAGLDGSELDRDPPDSPAENDPVWADLGAAARGRRVVTVWIGRPVALLALLYVFICSLGLLGSAFQLLGGRTAGEAFASSELMKNPIAGLMIGVLATVLLQSSSTSTSIVVTMVASKMLTVRAAIPIVMGANIGTSVTSTLVALAQSADRDVFRRAFAAATVHDMFNWLAVLALLPLECATGYLEWLTTLLVGGLDEGSEGEGHAATRTDFLKVITRPVTDSVIQLDKTLIEKIATGQLVPANQSLIKEWCGYDELLVSVNVTNASLVENASVYWETRRIPTTQCRFMLGGWGLSDTAVGLVLLAISLVFLCGCLVLLVRLLNVVLRGPVAAVVRRRINADLPGVAAPLTGYVAMAAGAVGTALLQSSSVFTATLTPLAGAGVVALERVYPLTLGANVGTTGTSLLAAAASGRPAAVQVALCHLAFNLSAIALFYPVRCMRLPLPLARRLAASTARYRWFAGVYLVGAFLLAPAALLGVCVAAGPVVFTALCAAAACVASLLLVLAVLQAHVPDRLPPPLRSWAFLPECARSLAPYDRVLTGAVRALKTACRRRGEGGRRPPLYAPIYKPTTCSAHGTVLPSGELVAISTRL